MTRIIETRRKLKSRLDAKQDVSRSIPALMGDGNGNIDVDPVNQPGQVLIRVGDGDLGQAFNNRVPRADNLAIDVGYDPITDPDRRIFQVLSVRMADYAGGGNAPYPNLPNHHLSHEFGGGDDIYVSWRRLMGFRVGRPAGFVVTIDAGNIIRAGAWLAVIAQTLDLTASKPASSTQARYVLISLNAAGTAIATAGALVAIALLDISDCPIPAAGNIPLAAVRLYGTQTAIGDTPTAPDIVDLRFPQANPTTTHNLLSAMHGDTLTAAVVDGDIIIGNVTPKWSRLAISIPAANVRNVLGIDNGELRPAWKTALDATNPTSISVGGAASPGTSLIFSHRDHTHGAPATWTATPHNILSASHSDTSPAALVPGDILYVNAGGNLTRLAASALEGAVLQITQGPPIAPFWSGWSLYGTAGGAVNFAVTATKTLTLTSTGDFNLTIPATGTAMLGSGVINYVPYFNSANSIAASHLYDGATGEIQFQGGGASCTFKLPNANVELAGGGASCKLDLPNAATGITGGGTIALGGFTLTIPATGTAALLGTANTFITNQAITLSLNGALTFIVTNANAGASARALIRTASDTVTADWAAYSAAAAGGARLNLTAAGGYMLIGTTTNHVVDIYTNNTLRATFGAAGGLTIVGAFGCNGAAQQTAYASGGALAGYVDGTHGLDTAAHMQSLFNLVVNIRAALVSNGIMS